MGATRMKHKCDGSSIKKKKLFNTIFFFSQQCCDALIHLYIFVFSATLSSYLDKVDNNWFPMDKTNQKMCFHA